MQVRAHEGEIVVAAVPEDEIGFAPGLRDDADVIDAGIDDIACGEVRLVFLALFYGAGRARQIGAGLEALHALAFELAVGHGVAHDGGAQAALAQLARQPAAHRRFAAAGAHRRHGDHRHARADHGALRAEQREIGAGGKGARSAMHHFGMGEVAVGEYDLFEFLLADQGFEFGLGQDRNAPGIKRTCQRGRIAPSGDAGNLRRGEGHDLERRIVAVDDIEIVEIAPGRAHDRDARAVGGVHCALIDRGGTRALSMQFRVRTNITDFSLPRLDPATCGSSIASDCAMRRAPFLGPSSIVRGLSSNRLACSPAIRSNCARTQA